MAVPHKIKGTINGTKERLAESMNTPIQGFDFP